MTSLFVNANATTIPLPDRSVHCIVTSPPYWGLRSYAGTATWEGGDPECDHVEKQRPSLESGLRNDGREHKGLYEGEKATEIVMHYRDVCGKCSARRIDAQLGLEKLHDCLGWTRGENCGECYICHMRLVAAECWRVLRDDGTMWINLGDSYASGWSCNRRNVIGSGAPSIDERVDKLSGGLKEKDLCMIPARLALAFQADGWYLRSDIIWAKLNPMPESVTDRPTKSHEYLFLFAKQPRYFFDQDAVRKEHQEPWRSTGKLENRGTKDVENGINQGFGLAGETPRLYNPAGRNIRSVWNIATHPFPGSHFATYPPALVEPCVKAGTSERGCCPRCGKPWTRMVDKTPPGKHESEYQTIASGRGNGGDRSKHAEPSTSITLGWQPACDCLDDCPSCHGLRTGPKDTIGVGGCDKCHGNGGIIPTPIPCTVLDPFNGAGTTGLVCQQLGRNYIGVDLSMEYLTMSRERLGHKAWDEWVNGKKNRHEFADLPLFNV